MNTKRILSVTGRLAALATWALLLMQWGHSTPAYAVGTDPAAVISAEKLPVATPLTLSKPAYVLNPEDVISVTVLGHDELSQTSTVLSDGMLHVTGVDDPIKAEGLTLAQVKDAVYKGLDKHYNNIQLSISVKESHPRSVTIIGARSSGQFPMQREMRTSHLIAIAGGLAGDIKVTTGTLVRNYKSMHLNIAKIVGTTPDPTSDIALEANDEIILDTAVAPAPPSYAILGAVAKPGSYPLPLDNSSITLVRAIADAGMPTEKAALTHISLLRGGKKTDLNLFPLLAQNKLDCDEAKMMLQDGDVLNFPEAERKYMVFGSVNKPSSFMLPETRSISILDAISEAGGSLPTAELSKAMIVRTINGKPTAINVNIRNPLLVQQMMADPKLARNVTIQPDDVVYIPDHHKSGFGLGDIFSVLLPIQTLRNMFLW